MSATALAPTAPSPVAYHRALGWLASAGTLPYVLLNNTAITALHTPLAGGSAAHGLAQLTGLLGGFALAVAGLLALTGPRVAKAAH